MIHTELPHVQRMLRANGIMISFAGRLSQSLIEEYSAAVKTYLETEERPQNEIFLINRLSLNGQSYPENAFKFYELILAWTDGYLANLAPETEVLVQFHMPYINTSSTKCLFSLPRGNLNEIELSFSESLT